MEFFVAVAESPIAPYLALVEGLDIGDVALGDDCIYDVASLAVRVQPSCFVGNNAASL